MNETSAGYLLKNLMCIERVTYVSSDLYRMDR
jgi:hypothetical protein